MSSSNCCFLTCIQISQEADQVVWYSQLLKTFPQFIVIHTVKGFGIVNKAEIDGFLELSCFFHDPADVGNLISGSSAFSKTSLMIWKFTVHVLLNPGLSEPCGCALPGFFLISYNPNIKLNKLVTQKQQWVQTKKRKSSNELLFLAEDQKRDSLATQKTFRQ